MVANLKRIHQLKNYLFLNKNFKIYYKLYYNCNLLKLY